RTTLEVSQRELHIILGHSHPNLVHYRHFKGPNQFRLYMEYVTGGTIEALALSLGPLPEMEVAAVTDQVLQGLDFLHSKSIVHLDIKGTNLPISLEGCVKICELGSARPLENSYLYSCFCVLLAHA
ncbi:kinase-like protein, partial [Guyanagaster necrorhizus]